MCAAAESSKGDEATPRVLKHMLLRKVDAQQKQMAKREVPLCARARCWG